MLKALVSSACRWLNNNCGNFLGEGLPSPELLPAPSRKTYQRLERVRVTDQVCRTMFEEFAEHRNTDRGEEEIGWVLLGVREEKEALVLATLPAGTYRNAGVAHVRFNSSGQALGSRIVRQWDKRLTLVGVVHTHPGSLRHPSDGDYQGDSLWVSQLRGGDGIFGIGTADAKGMNGATVALQPEQHRQTLGELGFSWYALGQGDKRYRKLPLEVTLGPDLAKPLHLIWDVIETHADALDCLCRQQAGMIFKMATGTDGPALRVELPLAEKGSSLQVVLESDEVRFFVDHQGMVSAVDPDEEAVDRAVYLILAELAGLKKNALVATEQKKMRR
jgi:proteasome lid subunit RPN8/RPN11